MPARVEVDVGVSPTVAMAIQRNPFDELERMVERINQQFSDLSRDWEGTWRPDGLAAFSVDVEERDDEVVVTADLPGFEKGDIDVRLTGERLRIAAHSEESLDEEEGQYVRRERRRRSLSRTVDLPVPVDEESVSATYRNGVLTVTCRATEQARGKTVEIQ